MPADVNTSVKLSYNVWHDILKTRNIRLLYFSWMIWVFHPCIICICPKHSSYLSKVGIPAYPVPHAHKLRRNSHQIHHYKSAKIAATFAESLSTYADLNCVQSLCQCLRVPVFSSKETIMENATYCVFCISSNILKIQSLGFLVVHEKYHPPTESVFLVGI